MPAGVYHGCIQFLLRQNVIVAAIHWWNQSCLYISAFCSCATACHLSHRVWELGPWQILREQVPVFWCIACTQMVCCMMMQCCSYAPTKRVRGCICVEIYWIKRFYWTALRFQYIVLPLWSVSHGTVVCMPLNFQCKYSMPDQPIGWRDFPVKDDNLTNYKTS